MKQIKVSVIVPVYNTEKYLHKCLQSLVNQTLSDIEIIIVNDGSTDSSSDIIAEFAVEYSGKITLLNKSNGGQASARNFALEKCKGEYIGFLDSDDFVSENMFEKMYSCAVKDQSDYVACGYTDIKYDNEKICILKDYVASKKAEKNKDLFFGALVSPFIHLYKHEIIVKSKVRFPEGYVYEDTAFYLNLIPYIKKISVIEEPLAYRVRHSNSTTTIFKKEKVNNIFAVIDNALEYYEKNYFMEEFHNELEYFCVRILLCSSMQRICRLRKYNESIELVDKTINYIHEKFPFYKKNIYFQTGKTNLYMKSFNKGTGYLYLILFRIRAHFKALPV